MRYVRIKDLHECQNIFGSSSVQTTIESRPTNLSSSPNLFVQISAAEMGDELTSLLAIFKKVEESGGQATLSVTTKSGVTKTKLELVSPPSTPATATTSSSAAPAPGGQRRRRRGPAARMKVNARAASGNPSWANNTSCYGRSHQPFTVCPSSCTTSPSHSSLTSL